MNLQVCVPYEKCPFNCPMCVASGRKHFENYYATNEKEYFDCLKESAELFKYDSFVITGDTEPTLNTHWLTKILKTLKGKKIELQTRNHNLKGYNLTNLTTLAYSVPDVRSYLRAWSFRKISGDNRLVILLTKEFDFLNANNFSAMGFNQITFKVLQYGADEKANKWVDENKMQDLTNIYEIVTKYNSSDISVWLDTNCQDGNGRYEIFRSDAYIYDSWESEIPM